LSTKSDQLEWRRSKVVEMRARGLSHGEIARELQVSRTSITSDIEYLRNQAKGTIKVAIVLVVKALLILLQSQLSMANLWSII
jgi:orotate phosphoribosyltransferase-like protein